MGTGFLGLLAAGWVFPLIGYFIPLCMLLGIGVALFRGRTWCNWLCPRGSFADALLKKVSPGRRIPELFRSLPVRVGMIAFLMAMLAFQIVRLWPDAYAIGGILRVAAYDHDRCGNTPRHCLSTSVPGATFVPSEPCQAGSGQKDGRWPWKERAAPNASCAQECARCNLPRTS